ncbi:MAG: hypothetical protein A2654_02260 [Candidatus Nealsonbacteria bacterium RIFCSPHIGHO2_01_FULL_43_31]|uniref:Carbohydrate kinase PfkB domain-containing protein n=1 Tax=Candidatus Nealsonbacteria bacterium RIFCSPHIGHO2_01_FULL_43_31 TaxID=1801665 RepID=A0A1G2E2E3_9BACT|nr:MAG: hypothetical protein A2654_02260 [Candidatus Nealsonbacteria bacterium RIFCSPHIGHO2_01_FULL_43_31]OGZ24980.1 MAG: hypothetical protein A2922_02630 [Candidatus Nealsonbacteria bacterium RIFCSPLOWO2_01_FULL_43_36]
MNKLAIIKSFQDKKVLLVGDTILDAYIYGRKVGKDLDCPSVPQVKEIDVFRTFGGASLVAANMLELGAHVFFVSVVGADKNAEHYNAFSHPKLRKFLVIDERRKTTTKSRIFVNGKKMLWLNQVTDGEIESEIEKKVFSAVKLLAKKVDIMVVADNQHGLLTENLIKQLIRLSHKTGKPLYVDSQIGYKPGKHLLYRGADCLFLNRREAQFVDRNIDIKKIKDKLGVSNVIIKLGAKGAAALFNGELVESVPYRVRVVDPCGAGDAFLSAFSLGDRQSPKESLNIANIWAALSVTIQGTEPPKKQDLINVINDK